MGGCCCCSSRSELNKTAARLDCQQAPEVCEPSFSIHGTTSAISPGFVYRNLENSSLDTYRAPPAPLPYNVDLVCSQTLPQIGSKTDQQVQLSESRPLGENASGRDIEEFMGTDLDHKNKCDSGHGSSKVADDKHSKLSVSDISLTEEDDVCPICLEESDADNPHIATKCKHHFHLSCILEWMERSDTCPICDQVMVIDCTFNEY